MPEVYTVRHKEDQAVTKFTHCSMHITHPVLRVTRVGPVHSATTWHSVRLSTEAHTGASGATTVAWRANFCSRVSVIG